MQILSILFLSAGLAACVTARPSTVVALAGASDVAIQYSSRLSGADGLSVTAHPEQWRAMEAGLAAVQEPETRTLVQVQCKLVEMDRADALSMLGAGLCGRRTTRAVAEDALASLEHGGDASVLSAPSLTLLDGGRGYIEVVDQRAYVAAFEITGAVDAMIGDPVIQLLSEGIRVEAQTSVIGAGSAVRLEFKLRACDLVDSMRETTARLPGTSTSVTLQQPLCFTQTVSTSVELGPEEALVIGGLPRKNPGRELVALVTTRVDVPETAMGTADGAQLASFERIPR